MYDASGHSDPPLWKVLAAFGALYLIWGSTYLAIRFAIETLPPFTMASVRFVLAGTLLWLIAGRKAPRPTLREWRAASVIGVLLLVGGNGGVVWAQQWVPSGLAALMVATVALWMVLIDWLFGGGQRPGPGLTLGLVAGLGGVALLVSSNQIGAGTRESFFGGLALIGASLSWASGSIYSRRATLPKSPWLTTAMQMVAGGVVLGVVGGLAGEWTRIDSGSISIKSVLALLYLIVFGALIAYSAYVWLLRVSTPARVSTYAYVNPAVAVFLGWLLADERLDARAVVAMFIILASVVLVSAKGGHRRPPSGPARGD